MPRSLHPRPSSSAGKHWECHQTCVDKADRLQKGRWTTEAVVQSLPVGQPPKGRTGEASLAAQHLKERHKETGPSAGSVGSCDLARTARRGTQRDNTGAQAQALRGDCVSPPPKGRESNSSSPLEKRLVSTAAASNACALVASSSASAGHRNSSLLQLVSDSWQ